MAKTSWHPAFCCALAIELEKNAQDLEFFPEHQLSKEPLRLDVLVIRKKPDVIIEKNIGQIFKGHNIIEYKSPTDYISIDDYHKVLGYAHQYKAIADKTDARRADDITITLACSHQPKGLFDYLSALKLSVARKWPGIYYVNSQFFATQIVVISELLDTENFYFKCLTDNLEKETLLKIVALNEQRIKDKNYTQLFTTVLSANFNLFLEVRNMITITPDLLEKFEEAANEMGLSEKIAAKGKAEGMVEGEVKAQLKIAVSLLDILNDKMIADKTGLPIAKVKKLRQQYDKTTK